MGYFSLVLNINSENMTVIRPLIIMKQHIFSDNVIANSKSFSNVVVGKTEFGHLGPATTSAPCHFGHTTTSAPLPPQLRFEKKIPSHVDLKSPRPLVTSDPSYCSIIIILF